MSRRAPEGRAAWVRAGYWGAGGKENNIPPASWDLSLVSYTVLTIKSFDPDCTCCVRMPYTTHLSYISLSMLYTSSGVAFMLVLVKPTMSEGAAEGGVGTKRHGNQGRRNEGASVHDGDELSAFLWQRAEREVPRVT